MKVLIAAPTGYVGRRLLSRVDQEDSLHVRVLTRDARWIHQDLRSTTEVVEADLGDRAELARALAGIDVAYYPIRLASGEPDFEARSTEFARMFRDLCIEAGVRRIVYLGTGSAPGHPSPLQPLMPDCWEILDARPDRLQVVGLFPGVIIGPGSVFYEVIMNLVRRLPFLLLPRWTEAPARPIALRDVVEYLARAALLEARGSLMIEIGLVRLTVADLFKIAARTRGSARKSFPIPATLIRLSAFLLMLATPLSYRLSLGIVRHFRAIRVSSPMFLPDEARHYFPDVKPLTAEEAFREALAAADADEVPSRWTDSLVGLSMDNSEAQMLRARYRVVRRESFGSIPPADLFRSILLLGGERGWFTFDILWRVRGFVDKLLGGFGTSVGRRSSTDLRIGDTLDVWRVADLAENRRLLLVAQMKVFGEAWLEFKIEGSTLVQTAYYQPHGALGTIYWFAMVPFHALIFPDMAKGIVERALRS